MSTDAFLTTLATSLPPGALLTAEADMAPYLTDWRGRYHGRARAVVRPADTRQVSAVLSACAAARVAVVPQGGNTGLCGGATPDGSGAQIVLSLSALRAVREVDAANHTLTVEAGCTLAQVREAAAAAGRLFPLSLASEGSCQIGGNIATNAGGVHVLRYGTMRDLVLGLEVVLPDGTVWNGLRGLRKDNTGYDLKQLFIGAEGTLGVITAAVLKLFPRIHTQTVAWLAVPSPAAALEVLTHLRNQLGERITAFELINDAALTLVCRHIPKMHAPFVAPWAVLVEVSDTLVDIDLNASLESALAGLMEAGTLVDAVIAQNQIQATQLWALRENIAEAQRLEGVSIKHDISLPVSAIPAFLNEADATLTAAWPGVRLVTFGHLGDGNLHYNLSQPAGDNVAFVGSTGAVNRIVHDIVTTLGGSISAEHGLGQLKREEILRYKSPTEIALMQTIKRSLDPLGLMNPGKVLTV